MKACPCGGGEYSACCEPRHTGAQPAPTPEALMRSRYSAYALGLAEYLERTTTRAPWSSEERESLRQWCRAVTWLSLEVTSASDIGAFGEVAFVARSLEGGELVTLEERSRFENRDGAWLYLEGAAEALSRVSRRKVARNEACPCGSTEKFKRCHAG